MGTATTSWLVVFRLLQCLQSLSGKSKLTNDTGNIAPPPCCLCCDLAKCTDDALRDLGTHELGEA